jgi:hypothetical protein
VELTSFLGTETATASTTVHVSLNCSVPMLHVSGTSLLPLGSFASHQTLTVTATAAAGTCAASDSSDSDSSSSSSSSSGGRAVEFTWAVFDGVRRLAHVVSSSRDPGVFTLPPNTLAPGTTLALHVVRGRELRCAAHTIAHAARPPHWWSLLVTANSPSHFPLHPSTRQTATSTSTGLASQQVVFVRVDAPPLAPYIDGGPARTVAYEVPTQLLGRSAATATATAAAAAGVGVGVSVGEAVRATTYVSGPAVPPDLTVHHQWTCVVVSPYPGAACGVGFNTAARTNPSFTFAARALSAFALGQPTQYRITLTVTTVSAAASATVARAHQMLYVVRKDGDDGLNIGLPFVAITTTATSKGSSNSGISSSSGGSSVSSSSISSSKFRVDSRGQFALNATVGWGTHTASPSGDSSLLHWMWSVTDASGAALSPLQQARLEEGALAALQSSQTLSPWMTHVETPVVLGTGSLDFGASYRFTLIATFAGKAGLWASASLGGRRAFAQVDVTVNRPPAAGVLSVLPRYGRSLTTIYTLSTSRWIDDVEDFPLVRNAPHPYPYPYPYPCSCPHWMKPGDGCDGCSPVGLLARPCTMFRGPVGRPACDTEGGGGSFSHVSSIPQTPPHMLTCSRAHTSHLTPHTHYSHSGVFVPCSGPNC